MRHSATATLVEPPGLEPLRMVLPKLRLFIYHFDLLRTATTST